MKSPASEAMRRFGLVRARDWMLRNGLMHTDANHVKRGAHFFVWAIVVGCLAGWTLFNALGNASLADWDEATYAQLAHEMVQTGDWITPHWNGVPLHDKPPLVLWCMALGMRLGITSEVAARLPSAFAGLAVLGLTIMLGRSMFCWWTAVAAAALLLIRSSYHGGNFVVLARQGMLDVPLTAFALWALLLFWSGLTRPGAWVWMGVPCGLAFMTKGLQVVPLVAALIVSALLVHATDRTLGRDHVRSFAMAVTIAMAIAVPWHLLEAHLHGREFVDGYFLVHLRKVAHIEAGDRGNWKFYPSALAGNIPRAWLVVAGTVCIAIWQAIVARDKRAIVLVTWIVIPFTVYSIAATKLPWYVVPLQPAAALLVASLFRRVIPRRSISETVAIAILLVLVMTWNHWIPTPIDFDADIRSLGRCIDRMAPPRATVAYYDPLGQYTWARPSLNIRPSVRFYANRPMFSFSNRAQLVPWISQGGRDIWADQSMPDVRATPLAGFVAVAQAGPQQYVRYMNRGERIFEPRPDCNPNPNR